MLRYKYQQLLWYWGGVGLALVCWGCVQDGPDVPDTHALNTAMQAQEIIVLSSVRVDSQDGSSKVVLTGLQPFSFKLEKQDEPPRLTIDVPQARIEQSEELQVGRDGIRTVHLHQLPGSTMMARLEIDLEERALYRIANERERLIVHIQLPDESVAARAGDQSGSQTQEPLNNQDVYPAARLQPSVVPKSHAPSASVPAQPSSDLDKPESLLLQPELREYRIGPGDTLAIKVDNDPELTQVYSVSEEGYLTLQYVGSVSVTGLTSAEIAQKLEQLLSPMYTSPPQVTVQVETYKNQRVFVVGAIPPATFALRDDTTLLEILSQLEGLDANTHVVVYRRVHADGKSQNGEPGRAPEAIQVDLERLLRQGDMSLNFVLQPRDVIYIPNAATPEESQRVFVVGAIPPETFTIVDGTTLIEILSQLEELKSRTHVVVYRRAHTDGKGQNGEQGYDTQPIQVDLERLLRQGDMSLNLVLEPRDVIYVPGGSAMRSITVLGEVESPGSIELPEGGMTVLQAIVAAGGFAEWAMPSRTRVLRMRDGQEQTIKVDVSAIMRGKLSQDIQLMPSDVIVVPERSLF